LGVGVWRRFDFGEAPGSGVSRGVDDGVVSSLSPDSFADFVLRARGDSCGPDDSLLSLADFSFAGFSGLGVGDFLGLTLPLASQKPDVSSLIYLSLVLLRGSGIFLVSETVPRSSRWVRIARGDFFVLH
jgi:hypothetical protein